MFDAQLRDCGWSGKAASWGTAATAVPTESHDFEGIMVGAVGFEPTTSTV
jgi:hypothetical protein